VVLRLSHLELRACGTDLLERELLLLVPSLLVPRLVLPAKLAEVLLSAELRLLLREPRRSGTNCLERELLLPLPSELSRLVPPVLHAELL